ncbi:aminoglycoside adenylyltransferase domain-containing protein [Herpetosiphon sp. NSE202]|uniref:aminoglycoside adenylyltransferase domain-containing protein n=1 Tax=Herpetosiphon sp. NSE202 TaxID=3351349 RepID=UPI00363D7DBC
MQPNRINHPELEAVLAILVTELQNLLGDQLLAVYLSGSIALGDWDDASDVDFMVVLKDELDSAQLPPLQALHAAIYGLPSVWAQHLEGSYISQALVRRADPNKTQLWYLDNGSSQLILSTHDNELVMRWTVREYGIALFGPPPTSLIEPIDPAELRQEIRNTMHDWAAEMQAGKYPINNQWAQAFTVISYCRMLQSLATGRIHSKRAGVAWALANLAPKWHPLIEAAWANRPNPSLKYRTAADPALAAETMNFVRACLERAPR